MSCDFLFNPLDGYQNVFLGASIRADRPISYRLGYNEDSSSMTIHLVNDTCRTTGTKIAYDLQTKTVVGATLDLQPYTFQDPDPGFTFPVPGEPVYFRLGDNFEFGGICQSWVETNSTSEKPSYAVTIVDPREILEGCQVILDGYVGGTYSTPNVFNVFALQERYGSQCGEALLSDLTGPGAFGGSQNNDFGMSWNRIRSSLMMMISSIPALNTNWSYGGRIKYCGYQYLLDLTEIPRVNNYRVNADSISIADLIKEITTFLSCDYYTTLEHVMIGGEVHGIIKIHVIDRRAVPNLNSIDSFIGNSDGVVESEKGRELRSDKNASILVGGAKIDMFTQVNNLGDVSQPTLINKTSCVQVGEFFQEFTYPTVGINWQNMTLAPFWGFKPDGGVIIGEGINMQHNFTIDVSHAGITNKYNNKRLTYYNITVQEIHCALGGKDEWLSYVAAAKPQIAEALGLDDSPIDFLGILGRSLITVAGNPQGVAPHDLMRVKKASMKAYDEWYKMLNNRQQIQFNIDTLFRIVEHYGTNFYGRKFMVRMYDQSTGNSFVCAKRDLTNGNVSYSREVADAGWIDYTDGFMGLQSQTLLDRFRTDDDRIEAFVRFNAAQNLIVPDLDNTEFVYQNVGRINTKFDGNIFNDHMEDEVNFAFSETIFLKCTAEKDFVFPTSACGNIDYSDPRVVITLPTFLKQKKTEITDNIPYFLQFLYRGLGGIREFANQPAAQIPHADIVNAIRDLMSSTGITALHHGEDQLRIMPNAVALPLKSNIATYGPWFASASGTEGGASYNQDESMVPWNYGDSFSMNVAGQLLSTESLSIMQQSERGSVTMPGLPILKLGDELNSGFAGITALREILLKPQIADDIEFTAAEITTERWQGLYGPNVTEISINIGSQGITTTYNMRTYTPSLLRNKYFADRVKNRGIIAQQNRRRRRGTFERKEDLRLVITNITNDLLRQRQEQTGIFAKSPHMVLVGQNLTYRATDGYYGEGEAEDLTRSVVQTQNIAEVQSELANWEKKHLMSLDGLLVPVRSDQFVEPDKDDDAPPDQVKINSETLNPFLGPEDRTPASPFANNYVGHNIEYVARDSGLPEDLSIRVADEYGRDHYRFFALRTPLTLAGWGYNEDGKPVPNEAEEEDFEGEDFTNKFAKNWLRRQDIWKVGQLDVRWSEKKGLWTFPGGGSKIKRAIMCTNMEYSILATGLAVLPNEPNVNDEGEEQENDPECPGKKVTIYNASGKPVRKGANIICYFDDDENGYVTIEVPDPIYMMYVPNGIYPTSSSSYASGVGKLGSYNNQTNSFNNNLIPDPNENLIVFTMNQPLRQNSQVLCYEKSLGKFWAIKAQHYPLCVVTDVNCEDVYAPNSLNGATSTLEVCDTTIWLESNWLKIDCGESPTNPIGGCKSNPAQSDFIGN